MKTNIKVAIALAAVAGIGLSVAAPGLADGWKRGGGHGGHSGGRAAMMMFEKFDADGDGSVTRAEADEYVAGQMTTNDADSSGSLSLAEFEGVWLVQMREGMVRAFQRMDRDGDGEITQAEIDQPLDRVFARADRNDDGAIEQSELRRGKHGGRHRESEDDDS